MRLGAICIRSRVEAHHVRNKRDAKKSFLHGREQCVRSTNPRQRLELIVINEYMNVAIENHRLRQKTQVQRLWARLRPIDRYGIEQTGSIDTIGFVSTCGPPRL